MPYQLPCARAAAAMAVYRPRRHLALDSSKVHVLSEDTDDEDEESEDIIVVSTSVSGAPRIVVDKTSLGFLEGSKVDYVIEMIKSAFVVADNPLSESACGCGSSFAMKNFEKHGVED